MLKVQSPESKVLTRPLSAVFRLLSSLILLLPSPALAAPRTAPWTPAQAWAWYDAQPWIRGCNYMPASAANHLELWQEYGSEARFAEVERELALAEKIGFNTMRVILSQWGFAAWYRDHDGFLRCFERTLAAMHRHGIRMIPVLGNDCSRPKELWELPELGPQKYDLGYHGGRRVTQHGSNPKAVGYTMLDDPELRPKFYAMCEELLTKYRDDDRILFWNLWNEPGNNNRNDLTMRDLRELFERVWKINPKQPLAADVWTARGTGEGCIPVEKLAAELSDIISFHCYADAGMQKRTIQALRARWGRPMVNTEWLARIIGDELRTSYPVFAQERVGCTCWGFVNGKYQTHEPYEPQWKTQFEFSNPNAPVTKWYHDLFRPSHHPYDPEEIDIVMNINRQMQEEWSGSTSVRAKIARSHKIVGEDLWYGYRRTKFDFAGHVAWVVEPSVTPLPGCPWTWTMQWAEAFVDRTGVLDCLRRGSHHVTIDLFDTRMDAEGLRLAADFQKFLVGDLGFAPKANLVGMSWGGFFSTRYAATYPQNVAKIYLDAPLLNFTGFRAMQIGPWGKLGVTDWTHDPNMPINLAKPIAAAGIPVLLLYGGQDQTVNPAINSELFIERFKAAGGQITVEKRGLFGHHPHGVDPDKTEKVVKFFQ